MLFAAEALPPRIGTKATRLASLSCFLGPHEGFTLGYARQVVDVLEKQLIVRSKVKTRIAEWPESWGDRMAPLGKARLFVKWIRRYMEVNFPSVSFQEALTPMDLKYWTPMATQRGGLAPHNAERDIVARYFKPLAAATSQDTFVSAALLMQFVRATSPQWPSTGGNRCGNDRQQRITRTLSR